MQKILIAALTIIASLYGYRAIMADHLTPDNGQCDSFPSDVNHDCIVNSGDLGYAAHYFGTTIPTWTPSPTGTPSPVPTATNTPSSGYTVANLVQDSTGLHEGSLCTPPSNYSWGQHGEIQHPTAPTTRPVGTGWIVFQWRSCGASTAGVRVQARNMKVYAFNGSTWAQYASGVPWCSLVPATTAGYAGNCSGVEGDWAMPTGTLALHAGTYQAVMPANTQCVMTLLEMRSTGGAVMADAGHDYWTGLGGTNVGAVVGSYRALTANTWRKIGASTCSPAVLTSHPPPL